MKVLNSLAVALVAAGGVAASAAAMPTGFSDWSPATRVEAQPGTPDSFNGPALDGCPFISRDERALYMASTRPGGLGGIDIWVAHRESANAPWAAPVNLGAPVNSPANDFCPTIDRNDHTLFFVSNRAGGCGGADIYVTRHRPDGWDDPRNVGCQVNSGADEASPSPLSEPGSGKVLYFSSVRPGGFAPDAAGDVLLLEPPRHARYGRHLRGDPGQRIRAVVNAVQPRPRRQQRQRRRDAAVAVVGRHHALLRLHPPRR
jgi:WD40-like Beta Propeller Repeat